MQLLIIHRLLSFCYLKLYTQNQFLVSSRLSFWGSPKVFHLFITLYSWEKNLHKMHTKLVSGKPICPKFTIAVEASNNKRKYCTFTAFNFESFTKHNSFISHHKKFVSLLLRPLLIHIDSINCMIWTIAPKNSWLIFLKWLNGILPCPYR